MQDKLTLTIIIPTKNRAEELVKTVAAMVKSVRRPEELIVVDQSATSSETEVRRLTDGCPDIHLKYIWDPSIPGLVPARVRAVAESKGSIIFFVDDDTSVEPETVQHLMHRYETRPDIAAIAAVDTSGLTVPWWLVLARRSYMLGAFRDNRSILNKRYPSLTEPVPTRLMSGGYMSFRRFIFDEFQFEDRLWGHRWCGSIDFSYRVSAKYPVVIDPTVRVLHRIPFGSYEPRQWVQVRVAGAFFFFGRNVKKKGLYSWVCFLWLLFAIFVRSSVLGMRRKALGTTVTAFREEFMKGLRFLRAPFVASY